MCVILDLDKYHIFYYEFYGRAISGANACLDLELNHKINT